MKLKHYTQPQWKTVEFCQKKQNKGFETKMPRTVEENGSAAMVVAKTSAGVAPEVNLRTCNMCVKLCQM